MPKREMLPREVEIILKEIKRSVKNLHSATEDYLAATMQFALLQGKSSWKRVKPQILNIARTADQIHNALVRK